ncbi:MAG: hypothetical protein NVSMB48_15440 [Marmoricola sp.]
MPELPGPSEPDHGATDEAWASIVENFGERVHLTDADVAPEPISLIGPQPSPTAPIEPIPPIVETDDHYIPPEVPRVGLADGPRGAAWLGLVGAPALFMLALLTGIAIPQWLTLFAVVAFLGSLGYLFATMRGTHDDDPWDDGSRI